MKRYKFFFANIDKPISIESMRQDFARRKLEEICNTPEFKDKGYIMTNLVNETNETLLEGVSIKKVHGKEYLWSATGWALSPNEKN